MKNKLYIIVVALLTFIFLGSAIYIGVTLYQYKASMQYYFDTADAFTQKVDTASADAPITTTDVTEIVAVEEEKCPISVDFEALWKVNPDIIGWIYCEDTFIDYPVLQGTDNDYYLHHTYEGVRSKQASIFIDCDNKPGFADSNTVIYGHYIRGEAMFGCLSNWADQEYFDNHSYMWLITPEQDYKIILFSQYIISAYSDETYRIFTEPCDEFTDYLMYAIGQSVVQANTTIYDDAKFVLLSTCDYTYTDARTVIHGMLQPFGEPRVIGENKGEID